MRLSRTLAIVIALLIFASIAQTQTPSSSVVGPSKTYRLERARDERSREEYVPHEAADPRHTIMSRNPHRKVPAWVPAAVAFDKTGRPSDALFMAHESATVQRLGHPASRGLRSDASDSDCDIVTSFDDFGVSAPQASIRAVAVAARAIHLARVVEVVPGFFDGLPASVLRLKIDDAKSPVPDVLVVYPAARFTTENLRFCRYDSEYASEPPRVDDTVLLFARATADRESTLYVPLPYELIVQRVGKSVEIPELLRSDPDARGKHDLAALANAARQFARETRK